MPPGAAPGARDDADEGYDYAAQLEREPARARDARAAFKHALPLLALTLVALAALALDAASVARDRARGFSKFFNRIDDDRDGELTLGELAEYLGTARLGVAGSDAATTARRLDSPDDDDATVSLRELRRGAGSMKSVRETAEWVRWGVGAPECANAFAESGVSSMDFPSLLAKDGERLRQMGVVRDHEKLTRAMTRQLLHVGRAPSSPRAVKASVERGDGETRVRVTWRAPKDLGSPRAHEYVVQSGVGVGGRVLKWTHVANVDSETFTVDVDGLSRAPGVRHKFRVIAWGEYGRSKSTKAMSNWVTIADENDAKWVSTIVSLGLTFRFVIAARGLIIRGLVLGGGLGQVCRRSSEGREEEREGIPRTGASHEGTIDTAVRRYKRQQKSLHAYEGSRESIEHERERPLLRRGGRRVHVHGRPQAASEETLGRARVRRRCGRFGWFFSRASKHSIKARERSNDAHVKRLV